MIALSALFLYFEFIADVILALVIAAIILTVYVVRLSLKEPKRWRRS